MYMLYKIAQKHYTNRVENYDAHIRHLIHSLRSRLLDSNNQIIARLK